MAQGQEIFSLFPAAPLPAILQRPIGTLNLMRRAANSVPLIRKQGKFFERIRYSRNATQLGTGLECGETGDFTDLAATAEPYAISNELRTSVRAIKITQEQMENLTAAMGSVFEADAFAVISNQLQIAVADATVVVNNKIADKLYSLKGVNPINQTTYVVPSVTVTQTSNGQTIANKLWDSTINTGIKRLGLGGTNYAILMGAQADWLEQFGRVAVNGSTNIDLLRTADRTIYFDTRLDDTLNKGKDVALFVMDGAYVLDYYSKVMNSTLNQNMGNLAGLAAQMDVFATGMRDFFAKSDYEKHVTGVWRDNASGILWDVLMEEKKCGLDTTYEISMQTTPQLIAYQADMYPVTGLTGAFEIEICRPVDVSCDNENYVFSSPNVLCVTNIVRDALCDSLGAFAANVPIELAAYGGDTVAIGTLPFQIQNTTIGFVQALGLLKDEGNSLLKFTYEVQGNAYFIKYVGNVLGAGDYVLTLGGCGSISFTVVDCTDGAVPANSIELETIANETEDESMYSDKFTYSTGNPAIGTNTIQLPTSVVSILQIDLGTTELTEGAGPGGDYTFDSGTHIITLTANITAGDVYTVWGAKAV